MRRDQNGYRVVNTSVSSNPSVLAKTGRLVPTSSRFVRGGQRNEQLPFVPPEDWYETNDEAAQTSEYEVVVQSAGRGFCHVVTEREIRDRLSQLPLYMIKPLEFVQLSKMTRKKRSFPCYGMQWGTTLYLYPLEENCVEYFPDPPKPSQYNEARMYGGKWVEESDGTWRLCWSQQAIKDFYLNNILIHELGHLVDSRNTRCADRERFAESFAIQYGYLPTQKGRRRKKSVRRRHHST